MKFFCLLDDDLPDDNLSIEDLLTDDEIGGFVGGFEALSRCQDQADLNNDQVQSPELFVNLAPSSPLNQDEIDKVLVNSVSSVSPLPALPALPPTFNIGKRKANDMADVFSPNPKSARPARPARLGDLVRQFSEDLCQWQAENPSAPPPAEMPVKLLAWAAWADAHDVATQLTSGD